jgi:hypothetical protein
VVLGFNSLKKQNADRRLVEELAAAEPNVRCVADALPARSDGWRLLLGGVRGGRDYVRYLTPAYADAHALRERIEQKFPRVFVAIARGFCRMAPRLGPALLDALFRQVEWAIPPNQGINDWLLAERPDVVLVTPLTDFASVQTEYVKSARSLGLRCGLCVHSWDNLTNKGLMRILPDRVFVWNEMQKAEAVNMHGVMPEQVVVTGAQCYDKWFSRLPSTSRMEFLAHVGLPATGGAVILYVCSSPFIAPKEVGFVRAWLVALRSDERLRDVRVLIRPHPQNAAQWADEELSNEVNVSVWPRAGANPITEDAKSGFYDSMYHCDAVVGINTSAMIEAGTLGKVVFTILAPEFKGSQEGTLHFHHLMRGGLLKVADDLEIHRLQLGDTLAKDGQDRGAVLAFIRNFVRPHGADTPCTPILADGIESLAGLATPARETVPWWGGGLRLTLAPVVWGITLAARITKKSPLPKYRGRPRRFVIYQRAAKILEFLRWDEVARRSMAARRTLVYGTQAASNVATECRHQLQSIAAGSNVIVVGPWVSEVGFEVLYWVPFLRWAKTEFGLTESRIVVVSRGGVDTWYEGIGSRYLDIFECFTPEQFRQKNEERIRVTGGQKHNLVSALDDELIAWAKVKLSVDDVDWLHPKLMYDLFADFWRRRASVSLVERHTCFAQYSLPSERPEIRLPEDFVAVKFYFSAAFPETDENRKFVARLVERLARRTHVVMLNTGLQVDDHDDFQAALSNRVISVAEAMRPADNLAVQTYVISRARAFFGTYGGFSYLPPLMGVPSCCFHSSEGKFLPVHLDVARRAYRTIKYGSFDKLVKGKKGQEIVFRGHPEFHALSTTSFELLEELL